MNLIIFLTNNIVNIERLGIQNILLVGKGSSATKRAQISEWALLTEYCDYVLVRSNEIVQVHMSSTKCASSFFTLIYNVTLSTLKNITK